jgi:hypothetical protein
VEAAMRRLARVLWWAGPWVGLVLFAWRQQTLEAMLSDWVSEAHRNLQVAIDRLAAAAGDAIEQSEMGVVRGDRRS